MTRTRPWIAVSCALATSALFGCAQVIGLDPGEPRDDGGAEDAAPADALAPPDASSTDARVDGATGADGSVSCPDGSRACGATCAPLDDPAYGCGASDCAPCSGPFVLEAGAACNNGACVFHCEPGHLDCTSAPGCETQVDNANCTGCGAGCAAPTPLCDTTASPPACVSGCDGGTECDGGGCVDLKSNVSYCGSCSSSCTHPPSSNMTAACSNGSCDYACEQGAVACTDGTCAVCGAVPLHQTYSGCSASACHYVCSGAYVSCAGTNTCDCDTSTNSCTGGQCVPKDAGGGDGGPMDAGGADACANGGIAPGQPCSPGQLCCSGLVCPAAALDAMSGGTVCP